MDVCFANKRYKLVFTDHARQRMSVRDVTIEMSIAIIETGTVITKERKGRFWVYKNLPGRTDNSVCLSIVVEDPNLVVVTALINWRPNDED
jgi:hypothetical protein